MLATGLLANMSRGFQTQGQLSADLRFDTLEVETIVRVFPRRVCVCPRLDTNARAQVGNKVLLQTGSKAGFFLCHLRDRPLMCELVDGTGDELYDNIIQGKVTARSYAFNDDGYRNPEVGVRWRKFAAEFLPQPTAFEKAGQR